MSRSGMRVLAAAIAIAAVIAGLGFTLSQSINSTGDVSIVAKKLADGRVEFALGQNGEYVKPVSRYLPADAEVGVWYESSTIPMVQSETMSPSTATESEIQSIEAWEHFTAANIDGDFFGYALAETVADSDDFDNVAYLILRCSDQGEADFIVWTPVYLLNDPERELIPVRFRLTGDTAMDSAWWSDENSESGLYEPDPLGLVEYLLVIYKEGDVWFFSATDYWEDSYSAEFRLEGLKDVVAQLSCFDEIQSDGSSSH